MEQVVVSPFSTADFVVIQGKQTFDPSRDRLSTQDG
jgi:hypothetical protein